MCPKLYFGSQRYEGTGTMCDLSFNLALRGVRVLEPCVS